MRPAPPSSSRSASGGRAGMHSGMKLPDTLLAILGVALLLAVGVEAGRQIERIQQLKVDQVLVDKVVIGKAEAWNRVYGTKRRANRAEPKEDLRTLAPLASWRFNAARD